MAFTRNHVAVVTGASSGIGRAIALELVARGATACLVARSLPKLQAVLDSAPQHSEGLRAYAADLAKIPQIEQLQSRLQREFDHVDFLVHGAGVISMGRLESAPVEDLDAHYRCNVRGPYRLTQSLLPMLRRAKGQIVFLNSSVGLTAKANVGQYAASKHALKALADSLREEVNADGVRVLSLYLGRTATPMQQEIHRCEGKNFHPERLIQPEEVATLLVDLLAVQQSMEITDITLRPVMKPLPG
jgi:short-subunit dehydrogenase